MPVIYQSRILRGDLRANPEIKYVFGCNAARIGMGGQAAECRGEPNAIGIATLNAPSVFFSDDHLTRNVEILIDDLAKVRDHLDDGGTVVFPLDGIGTGLARLKQSAPKTWAYLCDRLAMMGIRNGGEE